MIAATRYSIVKILDVVSVTQLEPAPDDEDPYQGEALEPEPMKTDEGVSNLNIYEMKKIVAERIVHIDRDVSKKSHDE